MTEKEKRNRGILFTVSFYTVGFLLLFFLGFTTPLPLPEEEGIMIDFGDSETGIGQTEPEKTTSTVKPTPIPVQEESNMTQDYEESATTVQETQVTEEVVEEVVEEVIEEVEEVREVDPLALYENTSDNNSNNSESEGIAGGSGNQGRPDGDPNSNQYTGNGAGNGGVGFSLKGRNPKGLPKPSYTSNEQGIVVVKITVDREGKVIAAVAGAKGSTTMDTALLNAAREAALSTKFDKKPSAPSRQSGTITYHFVLK
jgi:TonB family protein